MISPRYAKAIFAVGVVCILSLSQSGVRAQSNTQPPLLVSPAITEWIIAPGEKQQKTVYVMNNSDSPLPIDVVFRRFDVQQPTEVKYATLYDASPWFTVSDPGFILQPHSSHATVVSLQAPAQSSPGGHYATLYFRELVQASDRPVPRAVGQVGALEFIIVKGQVKPSLKVKDPLRIVTESGQKYINLTLHNDGNVHVLPSGTITIKDWRGRIQSVVSIEKGVTLPHTSRDYRLAIKKPPALGWLTVTADISYAGKRIGPENTKATVWLLPSWQKIIITAVLLGTMFVVYRLRGRWVRAWKALRART